MKKCFVMELKKLRMVIWAGAIALTVIFPSGCKYDSKDEIFPQCNSAEVTYNGTIKTILDANCTSCHSAVNPAGNLDLSLFAEVVTVVDDGRLLGSIKHLPGYSPMPRLAPMLGDCDILKIEKWINDGAPQN